MIRPRNRACRSRRQRFGNALRGGADSIRSVRWRRNAATWRLDRSISPSQSACSNRAQTRACQEPFYSSIAAWKPGAAGIGPNDAVEASTVRVADPAVDGRGAHMELSGDLVLRLTAPNGLDHGPAVGGFPVSLLMVRSSQEGPF